MAVSAAVGPPIPPAVAPVAAAAWLLLHADWPLHLWVKEKACRVQRMTNTVLTVGHGARKTKQSPKLEHLVKACSNASGHAECIRATQLLVSVHSMASRQSCIGDDQIQATTWVPRATAFQEHRAGPVSEDLLWCACCARSTHLASLKPHRSRQHRNNNLLSIK